MTSSEAEHFLYPLYKRGWGIKFQPRPLTVSPVNVNHCFYFYSHQNPNRCRIDMLRTLWQTSPSPNTVVRFITNLGSICELEHVCLIPVFCLQPNHSLEASSFYFEPTQRLINDTHPLCSNTPSLSSLLEPRKSLCQSSTLSSCPRNNLSWPSLRPPPWTALRHVFTQRKSHWNKRHLT